MIKLNRKIEYALVALKYISGKSAGQLTSVKEICASTHIPFDATSKVMQLMTQKNILQAELGVHGGYSLAKDLSALSFLEFIEAVSGPIEIVRCMNGQDDCEFYVGCTVISPMKNFNLKLTEFYRKLMISDLLKIQDRQKFEDAQGAI